MKIFLLSLSILCIVSVVTAQSQYDSIYTFNEGVLAVTIKEVTTDVITFAYPNEVLLNSLSKDSIQKIVFISGRTQVFSEALVLKKVTCVDDWENVSVSRFEREIQGLYKIGDVSVEAKISGLESSSKIKDRAYRKLKMEAALKGANVLYVVEEISLGKQMDNTNSDGQVTKILIFGIAYTNFIPKYADFIKIIEGKNAVLINKDFFEKKSMDIKKTTFPNTPVVVNNPENKFDLIYVAARMPDEKTREFRVTYFNESSMILMEEYKGEIINYRFVLIQNN